MKTKIEFHKSIQKSISNIRGGKHPCKKPSQSIGQQRIQPAKKPSKVLQEIDSNFKTTTQNGAARQARRPVFGGALRAPVVVLNFYRFFVGLCLAFLAGWILCWPMLWDGFLHGCLPPLIFEIDFWIDLWNSIFAFKTFPKSLARKTSLENGS